MSPVSQTGGLHLERYLGSYLITNSSRNGGHNLHHGYDGSGGHGKSTKHSHYVGGANMYRGAYGPTDGIFCPPPFCQGRNDWTGVPLISTANHRRNGKPHIAPAARPAPNSPSFHHQRMQIVNPPPCNLEYGDGQHLPLSKLALHTRGAPLILSRRYNNNGNRKQNQYNNNRQTAPSTNRTPVVPEIVVKKPRDVPKENRFEYKDHATVQRAPVQNTHLALNIDSLSVTSDESSGSAHSETCLPRIIKPRKRRKKDRKPLNNVSHDKTDNTGISSEPSVDSTLVTLNPFLSNCHEKTDINHNSKTLNALSSASNNADYAKLYSVNDNRSNITGGDWAFATSKESLQGNSDPPKYPSLDVSDVTGEDDEESDDSSSLFEAISRCSPTVCQCRYCDPSGQIWDIDQHASQFLSVSKEGFTDKGMITEKDTILRRSWSEPCPGYSVGTNARVPEHKNSISHRSDPNLPSTCDHKEHLGKACENRPIGVIGAGRRAAESSDSTSTVDWKNVNNQPQRVPDTLFKSSSSHGVSLEVSSSIVTSLNGHRDLEIKFFSTSPSAATSDSSSFVYPNCKDTSVARRSDGVVSDSKCDSINFKSTVTTKIGSF